MRNRLTSLFLFLFLASSISLAWSPKGDRIKTEWGESVTPENAWRSYPRPRLQRNQWQNLNGLWDCAVTVQGGSLKEVTFDKEILVPFCIESSLSGITETFGPDDQLWYRRNFTIDPTWKGKGIILHFGAVDYECEVFVNGKSVGRHTGGNNAFSFDISKVVKYRGENQLVVTVTDPTDTRTDTRGKQILDPHGIWYTAVSGIWKTVWLEPVSSAYIKSFVPATLLDGRVSFDVAVAGGDGSETVSIEVLEGVKTIAKYEGPSKGAAVTIPSPKLWTPDTPVLYPVKIRLAKGKTLLDEADSYLAIRTVSKKTDDFGNVRFALNGQTLFQMGPLDQGWWPDGLLTPPSEEAMLYDMQKLKEMGFNMIRKHIKVEPELYYYYADSLGIMLWQDMPSGFETAKAAEQHVGSNWEKDWDAPASHEAQWRYEFEEMVNNLRFYPCITTWVVFNEGWGQFRTPEMVSFAKSLDPDRIVNGVTGWTDRNAGDVLDIHNYPSTSFKTAGECGGRISVLGEFGGLALKTAGHTWNGEGGWGYRNMDESMQLMNNYTRLMYDLEAAIAQGLAGAVYTQTTDVENELNGFLTYDRKVCKLDPRLLNVLHSRLYKVTPAKMNTLVARSKDFRIKDIAPKTSRTYSEKFNYKGGAEGLSLWISGNVEVTVCINGHKVFDNSIRQTRNYNHYNISNYLNFLMEGENEISFSLTNRLPKKPTDFDFALTTF